MLVLEERLKPTRHHDLNQPLIFGDTLLILLPVCPKCGTFVKDLPKHLRRKRCRAKGKRKVEMPWPGSPEEDLEKRFRYPA